MCCFSCGLPHMSQRLAICSAKVFRLEYIIDILNRYVHEVFPDHIRTSFSLQDFRGIPLKS